MQKRGLLLIVALEETKRFTHYFIFVLNLIFSFQFLMSHCLPFLQTNTVTIYLTLFTSALRIICAPYPSGKHHASVVRMKTSLFQTLTPTYHWLFLTTVTQWDSVNQHICDLVSSTWNNLNHNCITGRNCVSPPFLGKVNKYFIALRYYVCSCGYFRVQGRRSCLRICA